MRTYPGHTHLPWTYVPTLDIYTYPGHAYLPWTYIPTPDIHTYPGHAYRPIHTAHECMLPYADLRSPTDMCFKVVRGIIPFVCVCVDFSNFPYSIFFRDLTRAPRLVWHVRHPEVVSVGIWKGGLSSARAQRPTGRVPFQPSPPSPPSRGPPAPGGGHPLSQGSPVRPDTALRALIGSSSCISPAPALPLVSLAHPARVTSLNTCTGPPVVIKTGICFMASCALLLTYGCLLYVGGLSFCSPAAVVPAGGLDYP